MAKNASKAEKTAIAADAPPLPADADANDGEGGAPPPPNAGAAGTAGESFEGPSMTASKEGDVPQDAKDNKAIGKMTVAEARAIVKRERGLTDAQVLSMNDDSLYDSLNQINAAKSAAQRAAEASEEANRAHQQNAGETLGDSGYNRSGRNE